MEIELDRPKATQILVPTKAKISPSEREPFLKLGGVLRAAALKLRYQVVLSAAVLSSVLLAALHIPIAAMAVVAAGFGLYASVVASEWSRRRGRREHWLEHPLELTAAYRLRHGGTGMLDQIVGCHEAIRCHVATADPRMRGRLEEVFSDCTDLVFEAARLERQVGNLKIYLSTTRRNVLQREQIDLLKLTDNTECPEARAQLESAAKRKREEIELYDELEALDDRGRSRIHLIKTTLDSVRTRLVKLRACQREATAAARFSVPERVEALHRTVRDLEIGVTEVFNG